ncbi:TRAP transporter small permease [Chloroflexota bacterium]
MILLKPRASGKRNELWPWKRLKRMSVIADHIVDGGAILAAVGLLFIMLLVNIAIVLRRMDNPLPGATQLPAVTLIFITFLGTAWLVKTDRHVRVDVLYKAWACGAQALLGFISSIIGIVVSLILAVYGSRVAWDEFQRGIFITGDMTVPTAPIFLIIAIGGMALLMQFARRAYGYLKYREHKEDKETADNQ